MDNRLSLLHRALTWFAFGFAPLAVVDMVMVQMWGESTLGRPLQVLNTITLLWILTLAYFPLALVFSRSFREKLLPRLAGFAERDEREEVITARAARHTFLITLALQFVLLVMSLTTVGLIRTPDGHGLLTLSVGMSFSGDALNFVHHQTGADAAAPSTATSTAPNARPSASVDGSTPPATDPGAEQWIVHLMPPGGAVALLMLILLQLAAFRMISRQQYAGEMMA